MVVRSGVTVFVTYSFFSIRKKKIHRDQLNEFQIQSDSFRLHTIPVFSRLIGNSISLNYAITSFISRRIPRNFYTLRGQRYTLNTFRR